MDLPPAVLYIGCIIFFALFVYKSSQCTSLKQDISRVEKEFSTYKKRCESIESDSNMAGRFNAAIEIEDAVADLLREKKLDSASYDQIKTAIAGVNKRTSDMMRDKYRAKE